MNLFINKYKTLLTALSTALFSLIIGLYLGYLMFHEHTQEHTHLSEDASQQMIMDDHTWTCSMHPHIRQDEPGDCPICGMDLVPANSLANQDPTLLEMTPEAVKLAQIETTLIGSTEQQTKTLTLSGKIQIDERLSASQVTHVPGRIEKLYVSFEGERVNKGQKIAALYSPELITAQQELLEAKRLQKTNPGLLAAARKKLAYWKVPKSMINLVEESGEIQQHFDLLADVTGVVTDRMVAVGDHLAQGEVLFEVVDLTRLWVLFDAYEEDLADIKVGDRVQFTTPALPHKQLETTITFIDPVINSSTRVASVRGEIRNTGQLLKPEMFVTGVLRSSISSATPISVPATAVLWTGVRSVVYVKVPNTIVPSFQYREVQLGEKMGLHYVIEEGLTLGEEVVTHGSFTIDAAAQLNNQRSMMNQMVQVDYSNLAMGLANLPPNDIRQMFEHYLLVKDALVKTDPIAVQEAAQALVNTLEESQISHEVLTIMLKESTSIVSSDQVSVQRDHFYPLSNRMYELVKATEVINFPVYYQYCPMAFGNTGAYWLAIEEEINNPYFGSQMLRCGTVREKLFGDINE